MSGLGWRSARPGDYAVVGDPIAHSLSPVMHHAAYRELGLPLSYRKVHVGPGELGAALDHLARLGYQGVNVTAPHKADAALWASTRDPEVEQAGSANTLRLSDRHAWNTDVPAFLDTLCNWGLEPATALMVGAGGVAKPLVLALARGGWNVRVWNRTPERASALALSLPYPVRVLADADPEGCALVVNATSASLHGEVPPVRWGRAPRHAVAYDLAYSAEPTGFMSAACEHGLRAEDGREMLLEQAALALEHWLDIEAPREAMRTALYAALATHL